MLSGIGSNCIIRHSNNFYLKGGTKAVIGKEAAVNPDRQQRVVFGYFCGLHSDLVFISVRHNDTSLVFALLRHGHRVTLSDTGVL